MKYILSLFLTVSLALSGYAKSNKTGDNIDVNHYEIHLKEFNFDNKSIVATTKVNLTTLNSIDKIELELRALSVTSVTSDDTDVKDFSQKNDTLTINFTSTLPADSKISLTIDYNGKTYNENWGGIHWNSDYVYNLGVGFDSQPHNLGKTWFPCVDNFSDKASYDLYITIPEKATSSCSGLLYESTNNSDSTKTDHWIVSQEIPTYLMSFAIGDFILWEDTYQGLEREIPIHVYAKPNQIDKVAGTFVNIKEIAAFYESKFGPYPLNRIGYVSTNLGCMEHVDNIALASSLINGKATFDNESFIAHEMSHAWFGDKVTCATAEDMWLNEGFATFCNYYYLTEIYGEELYQEYMNDLINNIILSCHEKEGWIPLNDIPLDITYGTTAYDKGAVVVHSLMNYLGRETFDKAIKQYIDKHAFTTASSEDLRDALTEATGIDMSDFFDAYVFNPGSPAYNVKSFSSKANGNKFDVHITMNQSHRGAEHIGDNARYEISFIDEEWNQLSEMVTWDGQSATITKTIDFEPVAIFCDIDNKFADACHSYTHVFNKNGNKEFKDARIKLIAQEIGDSTLMRVEHHWVGAKSIGYVPSSLKLSPNRYWTIHRLDKGEAVINAEFQYQKNETYDNDLTTSANDSIIILYRKDGSQEWQSVNFTFKGNNNAGIITVENIQSGDYILGACNEDYTGINERHNSNIKIYPNPAKDVIKLSAVDNQPSTLKIYNVSGAIIDEIDFNYNEIEINVSEYKSGIYYIEANGKTIRFIKE